MVDPVEAIDADHCRDDHHHGHAKVQSGVHVQAVRDQDNYMVANRKNNELIEDFKGVKQWSFVGQLRHQDNALEHRALDKCHGLECWATHNIKGNNHEGDSPDKENQIHGETDLFLVVQMKEELGDIEVPTRVPHDSHLKDVLVGCLHRLRGLGRLPARSLFNDFGFLGLDLLIRKDKGLGNYL